MKNTVHWLIVMCYTVPQRYWFAFNCISIIWSMLTYDSQA